MPLDKVRLVKLLGMTSSSADGEALAAIRLANKHITDAGMTWDDVFKPDPKVSVTINGPFGMNPQDFKPDEDWVAPHLRDATIIDTMFRAIYAQPRSDNEEFWQWMDSVHQYWKDRQCVTARQYQALRRCYIRVVKSKA